MDQNRLAALIEKPEIQQQILGDYDGGYSLGLTASPSRRGDLAIRVRIESPDADRIPSEIVLDGEAVPVIVNTGFKVPEPLKARR
jgi:hypothetical protein